MKSKNWPCSDHPLKKYPVYLGVEPPKRFIELGSHYMNSLLEAADVLEVLLKEYGKSSHPDLALQLDALRVELRVSAGAKPK